MKKIYTLLLTMVMIVSLTACSGETSGSENEVSTIEEMAKEETIVEQKTEDTLETSASENMAIERVEAKVASAVEKVTLGLWGELEVLSTDVDSYEKYAEKTDLIEAFYAKILEDTKQLCIKMREYSVILAEEVLKADTPTEEKYDELEVIYDYIYDDAGDDIYDEIYEGVLEEMYDIFYDGILDDAYDTWDYSEWSGARSNEYEWWSDTRSEVYEAWSDFRSDVYDFWSDISGEMWDDDIEKAEKVMADFAEDIEKLKGDVKCNNPAEIENVVEESEEIVEETTEKTLQELVDGMRSEFKEAMDSYEAFYDEYCAFMKKFNEDSSDLTLLAEYGDMLQEAANMNEAFEEWDEEEMNDAELKYYLEVNNRVMQKMLDVM